MADTPASPNSTDRKYSSPIRRIQAGRLGPFPKLDLRPTPRVNVFTGPNGSGKTTVLDLAWWALTGEADLAARTSRQGSWASALLAGNAQKKAQEDSGAWSQTKTGEQPRNPALYFREDGSFRVWDPGNPLLAKAHDGTPDGKPGGVLSARDLWRGQPGRTEGMCRDICRWQRHGAQPQGPDAPDALTAFTGAMSQELGREVEFLDPVRRPGSPEETPVIRAGNLTIPLDQAGAGTLRAASMAHLVTWMWEEHQVQAGLAGQKPGEEPGGPPTVIIDLPEAHLHLQLQVNILRALMDLVRKLHGQEGQWLLATHSPVMLAAAAQPDMQEGLDQEFALPL